jgi:hypothetical protein
LTADVRAHAAEHHRDGPECGSTAADPYVQEDQEADDEAQAEERALASEAALGT